MQQVDTTQPYELVYSLCEHPYLGYLIEPHVVQLNPNGGYSLTHRRVFSNTSADYAGVLDETDHKLIKLLEEIEQTNIIKRYHKKPVRPVDFFAKIFDQKFFDYIRPKIERRLLQALELLKEKPLFLMSKDGYAAEQRIEIAPHAASVLFHFRRNGEETRYFPTIKYEGQRIEFMYKDAQVVINQQAWLLLENVLYHFDQPLEGKKLSPFLQKRYIAVARATERKYFETFVRGLIEKHHVYAEGFAIETHQHNAVPVIKLLYVENGTSQLQLDFRYGPYLFASGGENKVTVRMQYDEAADQYTFHRIKRSLHWEENRLQELLHMGLHKASALFSNLEPEPRGNEAVSAMDWLRDHNEELLRLGYEIVQEDPNKRFFFGRTELDLSINENNDWFDVQAIARFGQYEVPFTQLRNHILNSVKEFVLPNGEVAIIPEEWFARYNQLFHFSEDKKSIRLSKYHVGLLSDISEHTALTMDRKLAQLAGFEAIADIEEPQQFKGALRPYQKAGYNWFHFLQQYRFGGCLADDMGLGKTIQTLAFLQKQKEGMTQAEGPKTSLIVMPTSLVYNWQNEADKFVPDLRILVHTGIGRHKEAAAFENYDLIITTYGIVRSDEELLSAFYFNYIILDESQIIKNPTSKSFKAVKSLKSKHRLVLSGTPVENSVADLWSQMAFLNPGLLGSYHYFQQEFVQPIEKKKDEEKARRLQAIIKPFVLRRTKSQVATELPPKSEQIFYCAMGDEQAERYERIKSEYRNAILENLGDEKHKTPQITLLQGLTRLRQLANHPRMVDSTFKGESGKFESVIHTLESVLQRGNKVLVFSQFVKQLVIFKQYFEKHGIGYAYLDGATKNREEVVKQFRENEDTRLFLISIKAGGVGLNLVEADYVFILDPWWNPAVEQQAIDRTHRIGQTRNVFIYKFITKDTVEEKILALQNRKKTIADTLITTEESFIKSLTQDDIKELLG
ncbi:Superfamily II DNA or RNA helicase, SNF2 family [Parapedobacter luteus]|uniref:Superfamily II DNA or RNA helicase, SNF2 family n=1 Tax=Parapedobacter luteus TaxID=623280 RepID=A0A1T4ZX92_9SPHI|nr:DEAD/DEAH box helicase [Parapedobacter luteus]SKB27338.1 Superfamily II DNA or RNA helicase, SNF2 family [Parapedobacter luteus]